ncbi:RAD23 family protein [Neorhodopirellula pilleata]|uniref:Uncharacterized protein n=1 Tax=Neorhodopirellula pilleata TaxID=2714738 RepID=A0A5C5ZIH5_9BACT|nr:hypothetical protein [Neorhodopirellula pilleata]TWT86343.1 hypothetical protein Pla100_61290 [Neorhodopirellula pilleata]
MHAIAYLLTPTRRPLKAPIRAGRLAYWAVLWAVFGLSAGCQGKRLFNPLASRSGIDSSPPSMHGPALGKFHHDPSGVRVTSEDALPETDLAPVEQRLATAKTAITKPATTTPPARPVSAQAASTQTGSTPTPSSQKTSSQTAAAKPNQNTATDSSAAGLVSAAGSEIERTTYSESVALDPSEFGRAANQFEVPSEYEGVDVSALMKALQDAPPEVQKAAVGRLIAMSRQRAKPTTQPKAIEDALAASFDSLPTLPDEVIDRGISPRRLAASQSETAESSPPGTTAHEMTFSDQKPVQPIPTESASLDQSQVSQAAMEQPVTARPKNEFDPTTIEKVSANQPSSDASQNDGSLDHSIDALTDAQLFDALVARLQNQVEGESEADRHRRTVMTRHLMVLAGDPDRAVEKIEGLSNEEQEFLRHQLLGLWTIIDPNGHPVPSRRLSSALPEMRKATGFLAAASDSLEVRGLQFCTEIEAYGEVTPFPERRFEPGQEVILYCEVENFVAADLKEGFETRLQGSYDLLNRDGRRVSSQTLPEDRQVTNNRLRDYFVAYQMYLPDAIEPGRYQLRLTMEDVNGKKYGQSTIDFEIKR